MKWAAASIAICLSGCATSPPGVPQRAEVPIPIPCRIEAPMRPVWAVDGLPLGADVWDQMAALRAERLQRMGYEAELEAAIAACQ